MVWMVLEVQDMPFDDRGVVGIEFEVDRREG